MKKLAIASLLVLSLTACDSITEFASHGDQFLYEVADTVAKPDKVTGERSLNLTTEQEEINRSEAVLEQIVADPTLVGAQPGARRIPESDGRYRRLAYIFNRVVSTSHAADEMGRSVAFVYFDDPLWNAFALGGNKMVFFSGFTQAVDDDELAAVIGHEMAHNTASHISEQRASKLIVGLAGGGTDRAGWQEAFTLKAEQEADELGILYAALAGYDPYATSRLWQRIPDSGYAYFRTHPSNPERVDHNRAVANQVSRYHQPGRINPDAREILACNVLYCRQGDALPKAGEGGGLVAALMTVATTYLKQEETNREIARQEAEIAQQEHLLVAAPNVQFPAGWISFRGISADHQGQRGVVTAFQGNQAIMLENRQGQQLRTDLRFYDRNADGAWYRWYSEGDEGLAVVQFDRDQTAFDGYWFWEDGTLGGEWYGDLSE